jgi:tetratricopeptide (TPR) repeat protein
MELSIFVITVIAAAAPVAAASSPAAPTSPAQQQVARARALVARTPQRASAFDELALALARRARETADPAFYDEADRALDKALALSPADFQARKLRVWTMLGRHDFAGALEQARALNSEAPDDLQVYGFLVDACVELGRYEEAERAAQWMLDLRPGNVPGLTRAAYLREQFGDVDGALELMSAAYQQTPVAESEDRAWLLTHIAHLDVVGGELARAEAALRQALALFPGYHYALAELASVRLEQGRPSEAVDLLQRRYAAAPHPENLYDLARALAQAGRQADAQAAFSRFEREARAETDRADNANRELVFYYVDHARRPAAALEVARREVSGRADARTLDAYAWALFASGRRDEARKVLRQALAVGTRAPDILSHARILGVHPVAVPR